MSINQIFSVDKFKLVYWVIAIATAQHTAWGAAITMQGSEHEGAIGWWLQGMAFAIAIDYSMVVVATKLRSGMTHSTKRYIATFAIVALMSFYFQLLYAWNHADALATATGVVQQWQDRLRGLIDARIIIAPLALPLIATLYTIGGLGKGGEAQPKQSRVAQSVATPTQSRNVPSISVESVASSHYPELPQPKRATSQLPEPLATRVEGKIVEYQCPGCGSVLSISGWSRHKKSCRAYQELGMIETSSNGNSNGNSGH